MFWKKNKELIDSLKTTITCIIKSFGWTLLNQSDSAKVDTINKAIEYNQKLLNLNHIIPTSFSSESQVWGLERLEQLITTNVDESINVQRNRQRLESGNTSASAQFKRVFSGGKSLFKNMI